MKELSEKDFKRAISGKLRRKLAAGKIRFWIRNYGVTSFC